MGHPVHKQYENGVNLGETTFSKNTASLLKRKYALRTFTSLVLCVSLRNFMVRQTLRVISLFGNQTHA